MTCCCVNAIIPIAVIGNKNRRIRLFRRSESQIVYSMLSLGYTEFSSRRANLPDHHNNKYSEEEAKPDEQNDIKESLMDNQHDLLQVILNDSSYQLTLFHRKKLNLYEKLFSSKQQEGKRYPILNTSSVKRIFSKNQKNLSKPFLTYHRLF